MDPAASTRAAPGPLSQPLYFPAAAILDSLTITLVGIGVIAFHAVTSGDLPLAIRLASAMGVKRWSYAASPRNMTGPAWADVSRGQWWQSMIGVGLSLAAWAVSLAIGSSDSSN